MPTVTAKIQPLLDAIARITGKEAVAAEWDSAIWEKMPLEFTERSIWSATLANLRTVESIRAKMVQAVSGAKDESGRVMTKTRFITEMREELGQLGNDSTNIRDIAARRRLALIYDFQRKDAASYSRWKMETADTHLDNFPAQELVRDEGRKVPRNWIMLWGEAGGKFYDGGRMIATKDDPVWTEISRFGRPWPPFDYNSGMGLEEVSRAEAEDLGVIEPGQTIDDPQASFNEALKSSVAGLSAEARDILKEKLGGKVRFTDDTAELTEGDEE